MAKHSSSVPSAFTLHPHSQSTELLSSVKVRRISLKQRVVRSLKFVRPPCTIQIKVGTVQTTETIYVL